MRAGLLRNNIIFLKKNDIKDEYGAINEGFTEFYKCKAQVISKSGNKSEVDNQIFNNQSFDFVIRYKKELTEDLIIEFKSRQYQIEVINDGLYNDNTLIITAKRILI